MRRKTKPCPKDHVDSLYVNPSYKIIYNTAGDFISVYSVYKMLRGIGLEKQAAAFMDRITEIKLNPPQ